MVCGLDAYAMKRCSMKRESIISDTRNSLVYVRTMTHAPWPIDLRTKCAELGRQLDAHQSYDSRETYRETLSNYSIKTNRCYITLTDNSTLSAARRMHNRIHSVSLYDGQTWELLATALMVRMAKRGRYPATVAS
jgi:hypothetical protein